MAAIQLTSETFQKEVLEAKEPVLVDFWAHSCVNLPDGTADH